MWQPNVKKSAYIRCGEIFVTGIELNEEFVKLQKDIIRDFNLQNIEVVCADVRNREDLVKQADLIIMNNVFSFFLDSEQQADCFEFIRKHTKKSCLLIHNPDIETASAHLNLTFTINDWLDRISTESDCEMFADGNMDILSDCKTLGFYRVR
ncbi:hypothetical protein DICVIV_02292 [Dictyocaulus viviparus]|uniref:Tellurite resistance methyltransferase TehB-like domain-containing protein n=1 Tax=Dictyocaulus viviparus TaxID=29172 RepID=A0A0D8Y4A4_DICVI|nr:hypothetical protein DICVIV_02292 [Dictyocaulus viviparus]